MEKTKHITLSLKNFHCDCCKRLLEMAAATQDFELVRIRENRIEIAYSPAKTSYQDIYSFLTDLGFVPLQSRELELVETIKQAVHELVFEMNNADSIVRKSEYLVGKTGLSFPTLAKLFSKHENCTLERYIIRKKIEKIKLMILEDEYTLSEIAYLMDYSSVHYLSGLFKKETGYTVTEYKQKFGNT